MEVAKKVGKTTLIFYLILCFLAGSLYLVIKFVFPDRLIVDAFNLSDLVVKNENGTTENLGSIIEIEYHANEDNSGKKVLDFKFNCLANENSNVTYSYGLQLVEDAKEDFSGQWKYRVKAGFLHGDIIGSYNWNNSYYYNYDDDNIGYSAILGINDDEFFLLTCGDDLIRLSLKYGNKTPKEVATAPGSTIYNVEDWNYIVSVIYEAIKTLPYGFDGTITFKFGDFFDYWSYDSAGGRYNKITADDDKYSLVKRKVDNYYTIKVNTYYTGATSSSDSMFGLIANDASFNATGLANTNDYALGKQIINLTQYDFDFIKDMEHEEYNCYYLQLKDSVKQYLSNLSNYLVTINLNQHILNQNSINDVKIMYDEFLTRDLVYKVVRA